MCVFFCAAISGLKRDSINSFSVGKNQGRISQGVWEGHCYIKQIPNRELLNTHGTLLDVMRRLIARGFGGRMDTCTCTAKSLPCSLETIPALFVNKLRSNTKEKVRKKQRKRQQTSLQPMELGTVFILHHLLSDIAHHHYDSYQWQRGLFSPMCLNAGTCEQGERLCLEIRLLVLFRIIPRIPFPQLSSYFVSVFTTALVSILLFCAQLHLVEHPTDAYWERKVRPSKDNLRLRMSLS